MTPGVLPAVRCDAVPFSPQCQLLALQPPVSGATQLSTALAKGLCDALKENPLWNVRVKGGRAPITTSIY